MVPVVYTYLDGLRPETVRAWLPFRRRRKAATDGAVPVGAVPTAD